MAVLALGLAATAILGLALGGTAARSIGLFGYAVVGVGSGVLQFRPRRKDVWEFLSYAIGLSFSSVILLGFALAELRIWGAGPWVLLALAIGTGAGHVIALRRDGPGVLSWLRQARPSHRSSPLPWTVPVAALGALLCLGSALAEIGFDPGPTGLLGAGAAPLWLVGVTLLLLTLLAPGRRDDRSYAFSAVLLVLVVTATVSIVLTDPLYSWTGKQIGITSFIEHHGAVKPSLDIFQAWPGFFSGAAWLTKMGGLANPLEVARWWPVVIEGCLVISLRHFCGRLGLSVRRSWFAVVLFWAGSVLGDSYFSPQSAAYVLALVLLAVAVRSSDGDTALGRDEWVYFGLGALAIAVTHQLSPYMVVAALVGLAIFRLIRSPWLIAVVFIPAAAWALINFHYVRQFVNPSQFGNVTGNIAPPGHLHANYHKDLATHLLVGGQVVGLLPICILAGLILLARRDRRSLMMALCAATGLSLIFFSSYGQEGILRVVLFAIPWLAVLAGSAVVGRWHRLLSLLALVTLPVVVIGHLFAVMGLDYYYAEHPGDIAVMQHFERTAPKGSAYFVIGNGYMPVEITARYPDFNGLTFPDLDAAGKAGGRTFHAELAVQALTHQVQGLARPHESYYAVTGAQPRAQLASVGLGTLQEYDQFAAALATSPDWQVEYRAGQATLYRLVRR